MLNADPRVEHSTTECIEQPVPFDEALINVLPMAVCTLDADGAVLRYNDLADRLCGGGLAEAGRLRILSDDGQLQPLTDTPLAHTLRTGRSGVDVPLAILCPDDTSVSVLANIEALRNEAGQITGAVICFQAHTPTREASADRRRNVEWLSAIVENTPECVKVVDRNGMLVQMNPAGLRMLEASSSEDVEGQEVFALIAPEHQAHWREQHQRVCAGEKLSWEFDIISLTGNRRHMETHAVPMTLPADGEDHGGFVQLAVTRDITERKRLEIANSEAEQRLRDLLDALPTAVYTADAAGKITYFNPACVDLAGRVPTIGADDWCVTWRLYWPDGKPMSYPECPMAVALAEGRAIQGAEALAERPDGSRVPFLAYPAPLRNIDGDVVGAVNMLVDITERKIAEDHRQLLLNELNHRVKNTLATVQSIAAHSFRRDVENQSYPWFEGRLIALSKAHDVLSRENWQAADLYEVVDQVAAPFQARGQQRFAIQGPTQRLRPKQALALAMALHELCTNASKYGALSTHLGQIRLHWQVLEDEDTPLLQIHWEEVGGPPVEPPTRKGFGSRLLELGLAGELNADVRLAYLKTGLLCDIEVPLNDH
ncbi:PAS domain-containing protein [Stutzerimonas stutzeri]|uniref:PAS domain-containing protein n=1 Tax=Stutzerimonas stutzeri TaxID=316 RepID=UPI00210E0E35|nr:PAS domain-containing protein [Stutzerimonas stutzeri]MCQ4260106.1 PAS domain-containing protein [Stutzerimonas stutzeri]